MVIHQSERVAVQKAVVLPISHSYEQLTFDWKRVNYAHDFDQKGLGVHFDEYMKLRSTLASHNVVPITLMTELLVRLNNTMEPRLCKRV